MSFKKRVRGEIDYNKEVPFLRHAPSGFYDIPYEETRTGEKAFRSSLLQNVDGPKRSEVEEKKRKEDYDKQKDKEKKDLPAAIAQMNKYRRLFSARLNL